MTGVVCYGLPPMAASMLIGELEDMQTNWLVCDTDMESLSQIAQRYESTDRVSICVLPGLNPASKEAVLNIVRENADDFAPFIWLQNPGDRPPTDIALVYIIAVPALEMFDSNVASLALHLREALAPTILGLREVLKRLRR